MRARDAPFRYARAPAAASVRHFKPLMSLSRKPALMCVKLSGCETANSLHLPNQRRSATW